MPERNLFVLTPAAILAAGFLRLRARVRAREEDVARRETSIPWKPPESSRN